MAIVVKLNATGSNLIWSTYLGGSSEDIIQGLAVDQYRQVYVSVALQILPIFR